MWRRRSGRGAAGGRLLRQGATGLSQPTHTHTRRTILVSCEEKEQRIVRYSIRFLVSGLIERSVCSGTVKAGKNSPAVSV